jgi:hypothetical protein
VSSTVDEGDVRGGHGLLGRLRPRAAGCGSVLRWRQAWVSKLRRRWGTEVRRRRGLGCGGGSRGGRGMQYGGIGAVNLVFFSVSMNPPSSCGLMMGLLGLSY